MKILDLLTEGKFSKSEYAYHATRGASLRSILKQGLIPNKMRDGYGSDETALAIGYPLTPLAGVYFTRRPHDAETICKQYGNNSVIIVCKIQPQNAEMDEDRLTNDIIDERYLYKNIMRHVREFLEKESENYDIHDFTEEHIDAFAEKYAADIIDMKFYELNPKIVVNVKDDLKNYIISVVDYVIASEHGGADDDSGIKMYQERLTQKLRTMTKNKNQHHTFKINKTIGFKGSNKIVGVYEPFSRRGWGELGAFDRNYYDKVDHPLKLLSLES